MKAMKEGKLESGSGQKVTNPKQGDRDWVVGGAQVRCEGSAGEESCSEKIGGKEGCCKEIRSKRVELLLLG